MLRLRRPVAFQPMPTFLRYHAKLPAASQCYSTASMYLLDMVKDYITRTRASIKGAVPKARDTAAGALVV